MDDQAVGNVLRALRRRRGWRQADVASLADCSQATVSRAEAGHCADLTLRQTRALFTAVEARIELVARWRGADLERLLDEAHAAVAGGGAHHLERYGWTTALEVTYSEFGERGSIDILATNEALGAVLVVEIKSEVASAEMLGRKLDEKARLAPGIVRQRYGWTPTIVGRVVIVPDTSRSRAVLERTPVLRRMFPDRGREVRRWLRVPVGSLSGIWFLSNIPPRNGKRIRGPRVRVKANRSPLSHAQKSPSEAG